MTLTELRAILRAAKPADRIIITNTRTSEGDVITFNLAIDPPPKLGTRSGRRNCLWCATAFTASTKARFCSSSCKQKAYRQRKATP